MSASTLVSASTVSPMHASARKLICDGVVEDQIQEFAIRWRVGGVLLKPRVGAAAALRAVGEAGRAT